MYFFAWKLVSRVVHKYDICDIYNIINFITSIVIVKILSFRFQKLFITWLLATFINLDEEDKS